MRLGRWGHLGALALCVCWCCVACVTQSAPTNASAKASGDAPSVAHTITREEAAPAHVPVGVPATAPSKALAVADVTDLRVAADVPPAPVVWRVPATPPPAGGWPVILLLHGWRSNEQDFVQVAGWFAAQGVVAAAVPAIHVEDHPTSRRLAWPQDDSARVHRYLQGVLASSPHRAHVGAEVWLGGFSQGARYALTLTAQHPDQYAGALAVSPAGWSAHPQGLGAPRPLFLVGGTAEIPRYRQGFLDAKALWERHPDAPRRVIEHGGGHHFPPDAERVLTEGLRWLRAQRRGL